MSVATAEAVLRLAMSAGGKWPLPAEVRTLQRLNTYAALRDGDAEALRAVRGRDARREYRIDPLAERIADAWAHYLYGQDPRVRPANDADEELLDYLVDANDLASELERAAGLSVSEGEVWARIYVDELLAPAPLLDWISRRNVLPLWLGGRLAGAAIVTELRNVSANKQTVYRHFEAHAPGVVLNALAVGRGDNLGAWRPLADHPDTAELVEVWQHGLPTMLVERIPNRLRSDKRLGVSDYAGILDVLLDLNEAAAIGAHNMRLTARQRAVISASVAQAYAGGKAGAGAEHLEGLPRAQFDPSEEVFVEDPLDRELGRESSPLRILSYDFDAAALIDWKRDLVETALTRVGLAPQYVGAGVSDGYAISGTALRLRLIPTDNTGRGKARYFDDRVPRILSTMALLDGRPLELGGFGRKWTDPVTPPEVERAPGIPPDLVEEAQRHSALLAAGAESVETAVRELHPEWDDDTVLDEVDRIRADRAAGGTGSLGLLA